jgi:hypothetical protein
MPPKHTIPPKKPIAKPIAKPDPRQQPLWKQPPVYKQNPDAPKGRYDLKWHKQNFDSWHHGYIWKKGYLWYRRPDGVDVLAQAAVNEMTEEGELLPKCKFTV